MSCRVNEFRCSTQLARCLHSRFFSLGTISYVLSRICVQNAIRNQPSPEKPLAVETSTAEIPLPILIAFLITSQETISIGPLIDVSAAKERAVPKGSTSEEVRTLGIVRLSAATIVGSGKQAIFVASIIGAEAISIVFVVPGFVSNRVVVDAVAIVSPMTAIVSIASTISVSILMLIAFSVSVLILIAVPVFVLILVAILVLILIAIPVLVTILVLISVFVTILVFALVPIAIATIL